MATAVGVTPTGNQYVDGLLWGTRWDGGFTYSFPDSTADYPAGYTSELATFLPVSAHQVDAARAILGGGPSTIVFNPNVVWATSVSSFIATAVGEHGGSIGGWGSGGGDILLARSDLPPTSYAFNPQHLANGGDVWFGTSYDYTSPRAGNYSYLTTIHELGHAIGLKHPHETLDVFFPNYLPSDRDGIEWTVMSYRDYVGDALDLYQFGVGNAPQTFMIYDIRALQTMYGADYGPEANNTATVYMWSPTTGTMTVNGVSQGTPVANRVFLTIWDGGGTDTYSMANYTSDVRINLMPGATSITSEEQRADLEDGHQATGCIYNAFLFDGDLRSIIENAVGGSGNDIVTGNQVGNFLMGNGGTDIIGGGHGDDRLSGGTGVDVLTGGFGADTLWGGTERDVFDFNAPLETGKSAATRDRIMDFQTAVDDIDLRTIDANTRISGNQAFTFIGNKAFTHHAGELHVVSVGRLHIVEGDVNGDARADFQIEVRGVRSPTAGDFLL